MDAFLAIAMAGGWFVASSLWIVAAAFGLCILAPLYFISNWTEAEYIDRSGWRFTASALMAVGMGFLLEYGGIPIRHYLFGTWYGIPIAVAYLGIAALWSRHRLNLFLPRVLKERDKIFATFCEEIRVAKQEVEESESASRPRGRNNGDDSILIPALTRNRRMERTVFMVLAKTMEPHLSGKKFALPQELVEHWEAYYEVQGSQLLRTGLTATDTNVAWSENKERIALWFFFWPSSMLRNVFTLIRDIFTAVINRMHFLFSGIFAQHGRAFEVAPATSAPPSSDAAATDGTQGITIPTLVRMGQQE